MAADRYRESFRIRSSEVNPEGEAKLQSICDLFQEVAGNHALKLNFDITQLREQNLTWVLHRLQVQIRRFPRWRERVVIETWPSGGDRLRAYRDFRLLDEEDNELGVALSHWLMLDLDIRKPVRMPSDILDMAPDTADHTLPIPDRRLKSRTDYPLEKRFTVRFNDLDLNGHVNNVSYIEWMTEVLKNPRNITGLDIEFHAECKRGDTVLSTAHSKGDVSYHRVVRENDQKMLALARMERE